MNDSSAESKSKPLWSAPDQSARLLELTSDEPHVKEAPLRRDVRSLGRLLGEVLKEQAGENLFNTVEGIRQLAIEYRELEHDSPAGARGARQDELTDRKSTRLNSSHRCISYAVFCLKKKKKK